MTDEDSQVLHNRLRILLPETYQVFDDEVQPRSMGSAGLKFGPDGKVLWDQMWRSFCDLAMAGGPPHRGKLLESPSLSEQDTHSAAYGDAATEICRGISLVTGLCAEASPMPGWVRMYCTSAAMANWLMRAIVMENVTAVSAGLSLHLPVGPEFRVEKEIKNVITSVAKTCHYWQDHGSDAKREEIADLLRTMQKERPMVVPSLEVRADSEALATLADRAAEAIRTATGLQASRHGYSAWLGLECGEISAAIWMMRALAASNVLSRRESTIVFLPLKPHADATAEQTVRAVAQVHRLARACQVL